MKAKWWSPRASLRPLLLYPTRLYSLHPTFYSDLRCMQTHPTVKCSAETVGSRDPTPLRDVRCCRNVGNNNPAPLHARNSQGRREKLQISRQSWINNTTRTLRDESEMICLNDSYNEIFIVRVLQWLIWWKLRNMSLTTGDLTQRLLDSLTFIHTLDLVLTHNKSIHISDNIAGNLDLFCIEHVPKRH